MRSQTDPLAAVPQPAARRLALRVTAAGQRALRQGHPWLFDRAITGQSGEGKPGDLAVVFDDRRRFLAIGLYDPTSPMRVRVLHHGAPEVIDRAWLRERLAAAAAWRATLPESGTTGYRLVHGENDGLPGLVIDRYEATLVAKLYSLAWVPHLADLRDALDEVCPAENIVLRLSRELLRQPEHLFGLDDGTALAGPAPVAAVEFSENGLRFEADVLHGQKTGFFLDQRDNRARVEKLAAGRRTLNVFAYSGGFSLYAARGGAPEVLSLDASGTGPGRGRAQLRPQPAHPAGGGRPAPRAGGRTLSPPWPIWAPRRALRPGDRGPTVVRPPCGGGQRVRCRPISRLAGLALGLLAPGGTLVMASCSSRVSAPAFFTTVNRAAAQVGRPLREIDRTGHAIDHPILFPEGAYLKCLFATAA